MRTRGRAQRYPGRTQEANEGGPGCETVITGLRTSGLGVTLGGKQARPRLARAKRAMRPSG
eukprot:7026259-Lingulodinium_polyedra.AAC.1